MKRRQFRFKKELFSINDIYNIPRLIICSGHGYDFKTYCCKNCGEIFVVDFESLYHQKSDLNTICKDKTCPKCKRNLETCLIIYPENIFHNGTIFINNQTIDKSHFEKTEVLEVYVLN